MCRWLELLLARIVSGRRLATSLAPPRGRWSPSLAESAVATSANTTHVSERATVRARVRVHGYAALHMRGHWGIVAVPCALAPAQPPACAAAFGRALPFVLALAVGRRHPRPDPAQYLMRLHAHCLFSWATLSFEPGLVRPGVCSGGACGQV
jgi:hypothetical protein